MCEVCCLLIVVWGVVMFDVYCGYGLLIGGVLVMCGMVILYVVGVDIVCCVKMMVFDLLVSVFDEDEECFIGVLCCEMCFGIGVKFKKCYEYDVMDWDWSVLFVIEKFKDKVWV